MKGRVNGSNIGVVGVCRCDCWKQYWGSMGHEGRATIGRKMVDWTRRGGLIVGRAEDGGLDQEGRADSRTGGRWWTGSGGAG